MCTVRLLPTPLLKASKQASKQANHPPLSLHKPEPAPAHTPSLFVQVHGSQRSANKYKHSTRTPPPSPRWASSGYASKPPLHLPPTALPPALQHQRTPPPPLRKFPPRKLLKRGSVKLMRGRSRNRVRRLRRGRCRTGKRLAVRRKSDSRPRMRRLRFRVVMDGGAETGAVRMCLACFLGWG